MKKLLLLLLTISFFSLTSNAQSTSEIIYEDENIKVEMIKEDCNYNNNAISHTYGFIKYTNLTSNEINVYFELEKWYNGVKHVETSNDVGDEPILKHIILAPNEITIGDCNSKESYFKVMTKHNHPKMNIELTDINFVINKIK